MPTPERPPSAPNSPYPPRPPVVDPDRQTITRPITSGYAADVDLDDLDEARAARTALADRTRHWPFAR